MCRKLFLLTSFVVVLGLVGSASSADIAISTQAGWFGQAAADREMQEIVDNVTAVSVEQFTADQQDALADWVVAHTGDGVSDLLILCGQLPETIYAPGNAQADDSLAELFLDDGNAIVNTGDYMFYVVNGAGTNATGGLETMMDIAGISMWDDNTPANVTAEGQAVAPSLVDFQTDRPFHLDELEGDWVPELILAQNDAGTRADPVIVVNTVTGGRLGIFYQTSGQDDDPRGEVISEWINNYFLTGGEIPNSPALKPNPADGAVDADVSSLEWVAGYGAVSHKVYLSTDATIDESDFLAEGPLALTFADLAPGAAYYWRVDEVDADGAVIEGNVWSFSTLPLEAHFPGPEDGAEDVAIDAQLSWTAGKNAIMHDVYFGTDEAAVAAGDPSTFQGKLMDASFDPGPLEPFTTYYWKVDEFAIIVTNPGPVWSFSTPKFLVISDEETTLDYDNNAEPYLSEVAFDTPQDLTIGGLADLTLRFHGAPAHVDEGSASLDEATGTYSITGSGADVWGNADQFHYGYRELTGDGEIVARVVDNGTGTNAWAKGGVMIRESLSAGSKHTIMALTGSEGGGITFQGRPVTGQRSNSMHGDITASPPHWVKLTRVGNTITAYHSADGVTWELFTDTATDGDITNPWDIEMADPVLIGLFVTSHQSGELRTYTFDNVDIVGDISADTATTDVGFGGNSPEPIYVALEDSTGAVATVTHPYAEATMIDSWRDWTIPLSKFTGADPTDAAMLYVGVGDGEPGGSGTIRVDDIRVVMPTAANIILVTRTTDEDADGIYDDQGLVDWLVAEGHTVDVQRDNWVELDDAKIAALNAADLIIVSRGSASGDYDEEGEPTQWNSIETPMILMNAYLTRTTRWLWLDSSSAIQLDFPIMEAVLPDHPIFEGVAVDADNIVLAIDGAVGSGQTTFVTADNVGNGTLIAQSIDGVPWIAEWEAGVEFFDGAGQVPAAPRLMYTNGTQEPPTWGELNLTEDGLQILRNAIKMLLPAVEGDVTVPGDIVKGVPDDGDWPGAETPPLAIDDNTGTKYLHFKGDFDPDPGTGGTGFKVTPLNGPSIVTGLTFTTANDVPGRDPIAFELSGSNEGIDGPYELIASGDIVDFAQEAEWPRFTKNETPISFENSVAYGHYQIIFTAIRGPVGGSVNSMQIAEVELIGVPAPAGAHWKLDDGEGTIAADSSGNGLDGILMGEPLWVAGIIGGALELDGVDDYVDCGNPSMLDFGTGDFTISAWINMTAIERGTVYAKGGDNSGGIRYTFAMGEANDNKMTLTTDDDATKVQAMGGTVVNDGAWHHVVSMRSGTDLLVYVDGVLDGTNTVPDGYDLSGTSQANALIGAITDARDPTGATLEKFFAGTIDDVRIYDRALSADEVSELAALGAPANILANGGFEDGVADPWSTYGDATLEVVQELAGAAVPEAPIEGGSCLHVVVGSAGANFWDAGLQHAGHVFEAGKQYTLSVFLKCKEGTLDINLKPERGEDPWEGYGDQVFTMTDTWAEYTVTTPVIEAEVVPATITFHIAFAPGEFWVDDARWYEVQ